jgi:DNA-binding CsgD family transcriptional regulator
VRPDPGTPLDKLSPREKEIVTRIARGESTRQMSLAMSVTAETVRTYVKNVLAKFGAHSRLQLAALASRDGLLIDQDPAVDVLVPAGQPIAWSHGRSLPRNGWWHGDIDAGWVFGAATDSSAHR